MPVSSSSPHIAISPPSDTVYHDLGLLNELLSIPQEGANPLGTKPRGLSEVSENAVMWDRSPTMKGVEPKAKIKVKNTAVRHKASPKAHAYMKGQPPSSLAEKMVKCSFGSPHRSSIVNPAGGKNSSTSSPRKNGGARKNSATPPVYLTQEDLDAILRHLGLGCSWADLTYPDRARVVEMGVLFAKHRNLNGKEVPRAASPMVAKNMSTSLGSIHISDSVQNMSFQPKPRVGFDLAGTGF